MRLLCWEGKRKRKGRGRGKQRRGVLSGAARKGSDARLVVLDEFCEELVRVLEAESRAPENQRSGGFSNGAAPAVPLQ